MIKTNYSNDTYLLDWEIDDFDTKSYREEGEHPTGINLERMRLPDRYDIAKFYQRYKKDVTVEVDGEEITRRKGEYGNWKNKPKGKLPDISDDFEWQITYNFPSTLHDIVTPTGQTYGGQTVTYRRLYLILCERFNDKRYFVDDYFDSVYPYTVKPYVDAKLDKIKYDLVNFASDMLEGYVDEEGNLKRGGKARIKEYEAMAKEWEELESPELARMIKEDIISSLATGAIPLHHTDTIDTMKERRRVGLSMRPTFYATKSLIEHINLYVSIGGNKKWETRQGILV